MSAWRDEQDAIGDLLADRDGDHTGLDAHWDRRAAADVCPAGGAHVPTYDSSHPDRMFDRTPHCDECQCPLPIPEPQDP